MSEIFKNAVTSIMLGVEDFETGCDARMLSAARNYYAGLLLLAKECLIHAAPEADPMEIVGAKFKPIPDDMGGVKYKVVGYKTIDLEQIEKQFKDFGLSWPAVSIKKLQNLRNNVEHYHLNQPMKTLSEAIASTFPAVIDFFKIIEEDPQKHLADVWQTLIAEREAFEKIKADCLATWADINWPQPVKNLDRMLCPNCNSSLIGQSDSANTNHEMIEGKCFQCGETINRVSLIEMVVKASYGVNEYVLAKDGSPDPVNYCPDCGAHAYVEHDEISLCFSCGESVAGQCWRCDDSIDVHQYSPEHPALCSYCSYMYDKVMRE